MTRLIAALLAILFALGVLSVSQSSAEECLPDPLSNLQSGRWTVVDPCATLTAYVNGYASSSGGAYWLSVMTESVATADGRSYSAKIYPQFNLPKPEAFEWVILTGALVTEVSDAGGEILPAPILWTELVPVWAMQRPDLEREYNEQRDDGWYRVVVLRRTAMHDTVRYYSHLIEPEDYDQAGIR